MTTLPERIIATACGVLLGIGIATVTVEAYNAACAGTPDATHRLAPAQPNPRICFPASKWDANDRYRPCVHVRVFEDGSYRAKVREADGAIWVPR